MKQTILLLLLVATPAAAQDAALVEGFAEGFTFHSTFAPGHKIDPDGAVVYARNGGGNTHIAAFGRAPPRACSFQVRSTSMKGSAERRW